jgi:hypothetical protein
MSTEEHDEAAWLKIASILGADPSDAETQRSIRMAGYPWQDFDVENFAASSEMQKDLMQMAAASRTLANKGERVRRHVQMQMLQIHNSLPLDEDDAGNPFADEHLAAIIKIGKLCDGLLATMTTPRGPKGDAPRRAAWLQATEVYERSTGRTASFGRSADQRISGPWVEFIRAFSTYVMPGEVPEDGAIEAFHKHRSRIIKAGGNPLSETFFGA